MNNNLYLNRHFLCIDLKSFFASCECLTRGVDPFNYPLVVANKNQGPGAITLAVTPYLKNKGVKSRGRLYEIPKNIKYEIASPHMSLYIQKSQEVISIYLKYVSVSDLHIYSIDECFLDVTDYLKMYKQTDYDLAQTILTDIKKSTGLYATCGIGPNMLLAKVSMDIEAKHNPNFIAKWTYDDIETRLWPITPLSKMWGIGSRLELTLNRLHIYSIYDLAHSSPEKLKQKFGVIGTELYLHANGIDQSRINHSSKTREKSYSHSQVLMKDYNYHNIKIIIQEMAGTLAARMRTHHKVCHTIDFGLHYSKTIGGGFYHSLKLDQPTNDSNLIYSTCLLIFDKFVEDLPIRKISISCGSLSNQVGLQLDLFHTYEELTTTTNLNNAIDTITSRFGKNSLLKASSLLSDSTIIERNQKIGGHHS